MSLPDFSIIVPVYNRGALLRNSLLSILQQNEGGYEVIVVDDGSTDDSAEQVKVLQELYPGRIAYYYKENGERGAARNYGARLAKGQWLNFVDSDDRLYPCHIQSARKFLSENKIGHWFHLHYDYLILPREKIRQRPHFKPVLHRELLEGNPLSCNGVFIERDFFLQECFCEDRQLAGLEDWELWLRLAAKEPVYCSPAITSSIVQHKDRSVLENDAIKLTRRVFLLMERVTANPQLKVYLDAAPETFQSSCYSYLSLHLALMGGHRKTAIRYLLKSIRLDAGLLLQKRFYAILKHLI